MIGALAALLAAPFVLFLIVLVALGTIVVGWLERRR